MSRSLSQKLLLTAKGLAMGAADVVPGVSGGTIAFIAGIYEELLSSIAQVNMEAFRVLRQSGWKAFWERINGTFFLFLFAGIGISIVSLAHIIQKLLNDYPIPTWSFFFGLILASVVVVYQKIKNPKLPQVWAALALGAVVAYFITLATPAAGTDNLLYLFFSGSIAIMAMILPGISGSFILLLLGVYLTVMETISQFTGAIKSMDSGALFASGSKLIVFALGCVVGLVLFARALKWLFQKAHDLTIAVLTGFLLGSLNKVWPWKKVLSTFVKHEGTPREKVVPLVDRNVWPEQFSQLTGNDNQLVFALLAAAAGLALVLILNRFSPKEA